MIIAIKRYFIAFAILLLFAKICFFKIPGFCKTKKDLSMTLKICFLMSLL